MDNNIVKSRGSEFERTNPPCRGRPRKYDTSAKERNKETMKSLSDQGYFKEYYLKRKIEMVCPICKTKTTEVCLKQHQKSKMCKRIANLQKAVTIENTEGDESKLIVYNIDINF